MIGIYQIRNIQSDKIYIGSALDIKHRWHEHRSDLRKHRHHSQHLQRAWNKHGADVFVFEVLKECESQFCIEREQYYLDIILFANCNDQRFHQLGYNICRVAGSTLGYRHSDNAKIKISQSSKGINNPMFGKKHSEQTKAKMRTLQKGSHHARAKLNDDQVFEIRHMIEIKIPYKVIATKFGVTIKTISRIKNKESWSHL